MQRQADRGRARQRVSIAATSLLVVAVCVGRSYAQSAEAEALFDEGDKLMNESKFAEACDAFEASNKVETRAGTLIRLGQCREQNHQLASAWSAYKDALTRVKDPAKRAFAVKRSAELEPKLSSLTITVPDEIRLDGLSIMRNEKLLDPLLWNRAVPVDGGKYVIVARAPGHEDWKATVNVPVDKGKVDVHIPALTEVVKLSSPTPTPAPPPHATHPGMFTTKRKLAIGLACVGTATLVTGLVLGAVANGKRNDAFALCPDPQTPCTDAGRAYDLTASGHRLAIGADILFGVAGAAAIGAGVLWLTGAPESSRPITIVSIAHGIAVRARF